MSSARLLRAAVAVVGIGGGALVPHGPALGGPAASLDGPGRETVSIETADGGRIVGTYSLARVPGRAGPGPALLLVHGEGQTRTAFQPLVSHLDEDRLSWLAIDLRGHGSSRTQGGADVSGRVRDPAFTPAYAEDVRAAIRWLVEARTHEASGIGVLAVALGASAAIRAASEHEGDVAAMMALTPSYGQPGFDTKADCLGLDGKMDFVILASVEDMNRLDKQGPRSMLYDVERARNAPPDTRREERVLKRRGIPPRVRAFAETNVYGTRMFEPGGVAHLDAWIASWWARRLGTLPHAVLFDGSVDRANDFADPGWDGTTTISGGSGLSANAVRWGGRVMIGGEIPETVSTIYLRVHATRGDGPAPGLYAQIEYPSGTMNVQPLRKSIRERSPPTDATALVLQPEELPQDDGSLKYGKASFEAEVRLPDVPGEAPLVVRVSFTAGRGERAPEVPGIDPDAPATWIVVPDSLDEEVRPPRAGDEPVEPKPPGNEVPDGPMGRPPPPGTPGK